MMMSFKLHLPDLSIINKENNVDVTCPQKAIKRLKGVSKVVLSLFLVLCSSCDVASLHVKIFSAAADFFIII